MSPICLNIIRNYTIYETNVNGYYLQKRDFAQPILRNNCYCADDITRPVEKTRGEEYTGKRNGRHRSLMLCSFAKAARRRRFSFTMHPQPGRLMRAVTSCASFSRRPTFPLAKTAVHGYNNSTPMTGRKRGGGRQRAGDDGSPAAEDARMGPGGRGGTEYPATVSPVTGKREGRRQRRSTGVAPQATVPWRGVLFSFS